MFVPPSTRVALLLAVTALAVGEPAHGADPSRLPAARECVVLLHGLGRTYRSMNKLARAAESAGYTAVNLDYPSRTKSIETLAEEVVPEGLRRCRDARATPINFVTHSMGGIVVRYYLEKHRVPGLGRVVMLSPPNQGTEAADALRGDTFHQWWNGPAGQQLGTGADGIAARLGPVTYPVGVIAGTEHAFFDAQRAKLIPGPSDGKVSVERTKVAGMADFLALPATHTFIMYDDEAVSQAIHFLRHGRFRR
jgi:pimeloyl-ACP methyl ester carboxylesterase